MRQLEERILREGRVLPGDILKVDGFLNHQIDPALLYDMALEIKRLFAGEKIDKILTVEASGIALAVMVGCVMDCPAVFAKKSRSLNISDDVYSAEVYSYTHKNTNMVIVSKSFLSPGERILMVDDFLANGAALEGLCSLIEQAGAVAVGAAIAIEKAYQPGGDRLRAGGLRIESLARIASMSDDSLIFCDNCQKTDN